MRLALITLKVSKIKNMICTIPFMNFKNSMFDGNSAWEPPDPSRTQK